MRRLFTIALSSALLASAPLTARTVDDLIQCNIDARGGLERIRGIETVVFSEGLYREADYQGSGKAFMAFKRPYFRAVGDPDGGGTFREGYDGAAWEWYADPGVALRTVGAAAGAIRRGADFEGPLIDYRIKGSTAVLGDEVHIGDRPAVRLTLTSRDGMARDFFLDSETCLVLAERKTAPIHAFGQAITSETRIGDYRPVAGVLFAHRFVETEIATGRELSSMLWRSIEANRDLPDSWFSPPEFDRTPLQRFTEQLYYERTDASAVMWTYHEFRRFHPEIDVASAVEFVGYQMLKMGDVGTAIELLEQHVADQPQRADAAFGLGRAYETAGDAARARSQYERALVLDAEHRRAARALAKLSG